MNSKIHLVKKGEQEVSAQRVGYTHTLTHIHTHIHIFPWIFNSELP